MSDADTSSYLSSLGADSPVVQELLAYNENKFVHCAHSVALEDESFVAVWDEYRYEAESIGVFACLRERLLQLQFPIREGISATAAYTAATLRGAAPPDGCDLELTDSQGLQLEIHPTAAGRIPLIITSNRSDFVALVCALARKNEPSEIPSAMGACLISGYNNWDRVHRYRTLWRSTHRDGNWPAEFGLLAAKKHLYQDRFIILSDGPYSGVPATEMNLSDDEWRAISLIIRREHECAHYYTRRMLGSMQNNLLDEIIADYMGIIEVAGTFRADWFLRFMGLESMPDYRRGGRFENYIGGLSEAAIAILQRVVVHAAENLESHGPRYRCHSSLPAAKACVLRQLTSMTLVEMASVDIPAGMDAHR